MVKTVKIESNDDEGLASGPKLEYSENVITILAIAQRVRIST